MTASTGSLIRASDYNAIQTAVATILGSGYVGSSGTPYGSGYGQAVTSTQATAGYIGSSAQTGTVVTASSGSGNIAALATDILKIAAHQGTTVTLPSAIANFSSANNRQIQASDFTTLSSIVGTLFTNRFNIAAGQFSTETLSTGTRTTSWGSGNSSISHNITVTFADANTARWFFIAGGKVQFTASRTGGSSTTQNADWTNLLSNMGTISFNYNSTSSSAGTGTASSSIGWFNLTTSAQTIYTHSGNMESGGSRYASNSYTVTAATNAGLTQLILSVTFSDTHTNAYSDFVDGTITSRIVSLRPTGSNVVITAPTVNNPTVSM